MKTSVSSDTSNAWRGDEEQRVAREGGGGWKGSGRGNNARALLKLVFQIIISRHCALRLVVSWTGEKGWNRFEDGVFRRHGRRARVEI